MSVALGAGLGGGGDRDSGGADGCNHLDMLLALTPTALPDLIGRGVGVGVGVIPFSPFAIALQRAGG